MTVENDADLAIAATAKYKMKKMPSDHEALITIVCIANESLRLGTMNDVKVVPSRKKSTAPLRRVHKRPIWLPVDF